MTLPSRNTGTPSSGSRLLASFDARSCSGNVIWLKIMAGNGIESSSTASRKLNRPQDLASQQRPDQPTDDHHKGDPREKQLCAVDTKEHRNDSQKDQRNTGPRRLYPRTPHRIPAVPQQKRREERHQEPMRVIGKGIPVKDQLRSDPVVDRDQQQSEYGRSAQYSRRRPCPEEPLSP